MSQTYQPPIPMSLLTIEEIRSILESFKKDPSDEKSAKLFLSPTGHPIHRAFLIGVITDVRRGENGNVSATLMDRTGKVTIKASSEYNPDGYRKITTLKELPCFAAVIGKPNLFSPEPEPGKERQMFVSISCENLAVAGKADRHQFEMDALELLRERCAWTEPLDEHQTRVSALYGPDCAKALLERVEGKYREAGLI